MLSVCTLEFTEKIDPIPLQPNLPWYNLKLIPSVKKGAPPDVKLLTSLMLKSKTKELHRGKATLEFQSSAQDPLGEIPVSQILQSEYVVSDFVMGYGDVIYDYLAEESAEKKTKTEND